MKVSDLIKELDISFNLLHLIGKKVNVEIKKKDQRLIPYESKRIARVITKGNLAKVVTRIKTNYQHTVNKAFFDGQYYYFIGQIKWFSNGEKSKDFGFASIDNIGDVFFHRKCVYLTNPKELKPGMVVFLRIAEDNIALSDKKAASRLNFWEDEQDMNFLVYVKINNLLPKDKEQTLDYIVTKKLLNLSKGEKKQLSIYLDTISSALFRLDDLDFYRNLFKVANKKLGESSLINNLNLRTKLDLWIKDSSLILFEEIQEPLKNRLITQKETIKSLASISGHFLKELFDNLINQLRGKEENREELLILISNAQNYNVMLQLKDVPEIVRFEAWTKCLHKIPLELIFKSLSENLLNSKNAIPEALLKENIKDIEEIFNFALNHEVQLRKEREINSTVPILTLFRKAKELDIIIATTSLDNFIKHRLWLHHLTDKPIIEEIYKDCWKSFLSAIKKDNPTIKQAFRKELAENIKRLNNEEISNLLAAHFYDLESLTQEDYQFFEALMTIELSKHHKKKLINLIKTKVDGYGKLKLFVDNYIHTINYDDAVLYTALLSSKKQKIFFKKCLWLIESGEANWNLSDFKRIISIDYEAFAEAKDIGNYDLDFSLSMIIHIAEKISNNEKINNKTIFEFLADKINDPKDLIQITGFFDECHDRYSIKKIEENNSMRYELKHYKGSNPRFAKYCEGRKAIGKDGKPATWKDTGEEFYWCENQPCFNIARKAHKNDEWKNYSLADVLRILNISYSEKQYEQLIGTVNKANRFFEHLNCRECGHILHPSGKNNYGFYRVSNFECKNPNCNENDNIYLSHCANGQCMDIVDSRDTVRCKTEGNNDECGWYVCNNCHACCTTKNIKSRVYRLKQIGQEYDCHREGHWDRQKICCNECGTEMNEYNSNYDEVLQWFLQEKENHPNITKSGINRYNKNWFIWIQGNFSYEKYRATLENLRRSGFNIPNFEEMNNTSQLIAEPRYHPNTNDKNYKCPACENELIVRKDTLLADKYYAINKYHLERNVN